MPVVKRSVVVPYRQHQMFELVNDVDSYPEFVPACVDSHVTPVDENEVEATLKFARGGIHKSFTTRNRLTPYERIDIELINGPFHHLEGFWYFDAVDENQCKIELDLEFEFAGRWLSMAFGPVFHQVANKLVDVFCKRAEVVYGTQKLKSDD